MNLSHLLNHLGEDREQYYNAVAPPLIQSSNFAFPTLEGFRNALADEMGSHIYTRGNNPTVEILRKKIAALEGAEDALVFSSGAGAVAAAVLGNVQAGGHVVCVENPYSWTKALLSKLLPRFGVAHSFVPGADTAAIEAAIRPNTSLLFLESPNSITLGLQDLEACAALAKKYGLVSCIDNSYASPLYQRPLDWGIDISIHSGTKYLNGHSDVVFGALAGSGTMIRKLFESELMTLGGILSPHDAWLVIRGLRTLPLRLQRSNESALLIAQRLEQHPAVEAVLHPLLPSFPQYHLAQKQMSGAGGLFSAYFRAQNIEQMENFFHSLRCFLLAVSWGGHESLVLPTAAFYKIPGRPDSALPWNLVRFYIGLEDPDWLWEDLENAVLNFS